MFLIKIFHFLKGYVILSVWGKDKEKFLTALTKAGIRARDLRYERRKIFFKISLPDFFRIRETKAHVKLHIEKKCGLPFILKRLKKRRAFLVGFLIFLVMVIAGSQFVWTVEYEGVENCDMERLSEAVLLAGVKPGMYRGSLKEPLQMKDIILANTDDIAWAWVYIKGTRVTVSVREDIIPPEVFDPDTPCDIIAARNGIIKRVITKRGISVINPNQAVTPGDTIILGTYNFEDKPGYQVHASGIVEAYTEHTKTGTYKQYYCYREYTGKKKRKITLKFFKWELPLYIKKDSGFSLYEKEEKNYDLKLPNDNYIGLGIKSETYYEYTEKKEPISYDVTVDMAKRKLEAEIAKELLPGAELIDEKLDVSVIDGETIKVTLTMNFIEEIGTEKRIEEVTFVEPKTDRTSGGN